MRCLHCDRELSEAFFEEWSRTPAAASGHFFCPHCSAEHVRREVGRAPSGKPQHSVRLWGHLSEIRRRKNKGNRPPLP